MTSAEKSKKSRSKAPRGRPPATTTISQPVVEDASLLTALSSFSPKGNLFAFLSLAVDKHRLRVYDTATGQSVAEHVLDSARVSSLTWTNFDSTETVDTEEPPNKKKRKKSSSAEGPPQVGAGIQVVVLGLSDGTVQFFAPTHGRIIRTLSHSSSTAAILSVVPAHREENSTWTSGADGAIRLWNAQKNELLGSWKNDDRIPYSSMAVRPPINEDDDHRIDVLVAHHSIKLLSTTPDALTEKPTQRASFTGHASPIKCIQWDASQTPPARFTTMAEGDRIVSIWQTPPEASPAEGKMVASIQLDSPAKSTSFALSSPAASESSDERQNLLTLTASGNVSIFPIPTELASSSRTQQHKVATLLPRSTLSVSSKKGSSGSPVVDASFAAGVAGHIRLARLLAGVRPVFDLVPYLDDKGDFIPEVSIDDVQPDMLTPSLSVSAAAPNRRYTESGSRPVAVRSGAELGRDADMDMDMDAVGAPNIVDGDLDVDVAELSLGQRLTALSGDTRPLASASSESSDDEATKKSTGGHRRQSNNAQHAPSVAPANSLTRTLIQALHSSDTRLLETCLAHSDHTLILNTIRRLPPQLAVPLITACVERLGRGARAGNMKGGGGGASSQRGGALIVWVRTVLAVHSGHLMTMPDLVARLAGLHATLSARLALQENLLSLSGRLDMVLSQIEMRSSVAPAPLVPRKGSRAEGRNVTRYVEGESADEDERMEVDVEGEDDEESVEDVELGGDSSEEGSEEEEDEEEEDEEEDSDEDGSINGFIDDEAEEYSEEDDDDSE